MTFTYIGTLATDLDTIRFRIGDTTENGGLKPNQVNFSDEEITGLLALEGNVNRTIAALYESLASVWAIYANSAIGSRKEESSVISKQYKALGEDWRSKYGETGASTGISVGIFDEGISEDAAT